MFTHFPIKQCSEIPEKVVPDRLGLKRLGRLQDGLILKLVGDGLYLKGIRINPMFPEPIRSPELDVARGNSCNSSEGITQSPATVAILKAKCDIGNSVFHQGIKVVRDGIQAMKILFRRVNEVPVAALQGEAMSDFSETSDDVNNWLVNGIQIKCGESIFAVLGVSFIPNELHRFAKRFQWSSTSPQGKRLAHWVWECEAFSKSM
jgi:hypothetical protein